MMAGGSPERSLADVIAVVQLPPPVNGLSMVNAEMVRRFERSGRLAATWNVAAASQGSRAARTIQRAYRVAVAAWSLRFRRPSGARILYMPCDGGFGLVFNIVLALTARLAGMKVWFHHHSFAYLNRRSELFAGLLLSAPRGTIHIGLCDEMIAALKARYPDEWLRSCAEGRVLPNAFLTAEPSSRSPGPNGPRLRIGHLSNLSVEKGAVAFLEVVAGLQARGVDAEGVLAGPITDPRVTSALQHHQAYLGDRVKWLGPLYGDEKSAFLESLDAFVFPTRYVNEAQPLVLLEALAAGAPILAAARGCIDCDHGDSPGLVVPADAFTGQAVDWIERELATDEQRRALRAAAIERCAELRDEAEKAMISLIASA